MDRRGAPAFPILQSGSEMGRPITSWGGAINHNALLTACRLKWAPISAFLLSGAADYLCVIFPSSLLHHIYPITTLFIRGVDYHDADSFLVVPEHSIGALSILYCI